MTKEFEITPESKKRAARAVTDSDMILATVDVAGPPERVYRALNTDGGAVVGIWRHIPHDGMDGGPPGWRSMVRHLTPRRR